MYIFKGLISLLFISKEESTNMQIIDNIKKIIGIILVNFLFVPNSLKSDDLFKYHIDG